MLEMKQPATASAGQAVGRWVMLGKVPWSYFYDTVGHRIADHRDLNLPHPMSYTLQPGYAQHPVQTRSGSLAIKVAI